MTNITVYGSHKVISIDGDEIYINWNKLTSCEECFYSVTDGKNLYCCFGARTLTNWGGFCHRGCKEDE